VSGPDKKKNKSKKPASKAPKEPEDSRLTEIKGKINSVKNAFDAKKNLVKAEIENEISSDAIKQFLVTGKLEIHKHGKTLSLDSNDISAS